MSAINLAEVKLNVTTPGYARALRTCSTVRDKWKKDLLGVLGVLGVLVIIPSTKVRS
jgi:hypothetical protein